MLRRLARYLLTETLWFYLLGLSAFILLISIDTLTVFTRFLVEQEAGLGAVGRLLLFKFPWFLHLTLPIAVVFALLLATGRLARDSELKAAYSLGASPLKLLAPVAILGLAVSGLTLINNGYLEPRSERSYQNLINSFIYVRPPAETQSNVSYRIGDAIYFAGRVRSNLDDLDSASLSGILVLQDDDLFSAPRGVWDSTALTWTLEDALVVRGRREPQAIGTIALPFELEATPSETLARTETLTLGELRVRIADLLRAGGDANELRFQLHRRIADALSATIFAPVAGALGLNLRGRSAGFAWTIVLLVLFWAVWTVAGDLFSGGVLGPVVAAWFTPAAVSLIGLVLSVRSLRG